MERERCKMPGCGETGILSFRGRPHHKYCQVHFEELGNRIRKIEIEKRRMERLQHAENNPARIEQEQ